MCIYIYINIQELNSEVALLVQKLGESSELSILFLLEILYISLLFGV